MSALIRVLRLKCDGYVIEIYFEICYCGISDTENKGFQVVSQLIAWTTFSLEVQFLRKIDYYGIAINNCTVGFTE